MVRTDEDGDQASDPTNQLQPPGVPLPTEPLHAKRGVDQGWYLHGAGHEESPVVVHAQITGALRQAVVHQAIDQPGSSIQDRNT